MCQNSARRGTCCSITSSHFSVYALLYRPILVKRARLTNNFTFFLLSILVLYVSVRERNRLNHANCNHLELRMFNTYLFAEISSFRLRPVLKIVNKCKVYVSDCLKL